MMIVEELETIENLVYGYGGKYLSKADDRFLHELQVFLRDGKKRIFIFRNCSIDIEQHSYAWYSRKSADEYPKVHRDL